MPIEKKSAIGVYLFVGFCLIIGVVSLAGGATTRTVIYDDRFGNFSSSIHNELENETGIRYNDDVSMRTRYAAYSTAAKLRRATFNQYSANTAVAMAARLLHSTFNSYSSREVTRNAAKANLSGATFTGQVAVTAAYGGGALLYATNSGSGANTQGMQGLSNYTTGVNYGVYGASASSTGYGVYGYAYRTNGLNYGVLGRTASATGYGGYFYGGLGLYGSTVLSGDGKYDGEYKIGGTRFGNFSTSNKGQHATFHGKGAFTSFSTTNASNLTAKLTATRFTSFSSVGHVRNAEKAAANGVATLDTWGVVVQNPANATATPGAAKIPMADSGGKLVTGWIPNYLSSTRFTNLSTSNKNAHATFHSKTAFSSFSTTNATGLAAKAPIASPTFTGTVGGITAAMVGLGNVTNNLQHTAAAFGGYSTNMVTALASKVGNTGFNTYTSSKQFVGGNVQQLYTNMTTTSGSWKKVILDHTNYNTGLTVDTANNKVVIVTPGKYHIHATLCFKPNANNNRYLYIAQNTVNKGAISYPAIAGGGYTIWSYDYYLDCIKDDYLEMYVKQDTGGNLESIYSWFNIYLMH